MVDCWELSRVNCCTDNDYIRFSNIRWDKIRYDRIRYAEVKYNTKKRTEQSVAQMCHIKSQRRPRALSKRRKRSEEGR